MLQEYVNILPIMENCCKVFSNLKTKYKQDAFFKTHMSLIEPKRYRLRKRIIRGGQPRIGENRDLKVEEDEIIYISIVELVKNLLSNEEYKKLIEPDTSIKKDVLRSCEDGSFVKENKLVQECGKNCILFMVYFDEANLTDTSSARPTKMGMFYIIIINIHPRHRSKLMCINLCLTVEADLMNAYEMDDILTPILNDIKTFENGVEMPDGSTTYGTLLAVIADNLGAHKIGGFKEGFTASHCCRVCMADLGKVRSMTREDTSLLRTIEEYTEQINKLESAKTMNSKKQLSREYGINRGCIFNELNHYHVLSGLPPDIFHDVLEGSLLRTLQLLLARCLLGEKKIMSLQEFNDKLMEFDYGYSETKPSIILVQHLKDEANLHQTGMQIWYLAIFVPFILGPDIDEDDEYYQNYLLLLEITSLAFAHEISLTMIGYWKIIIDEYLTTFLRLYETHLTPKQHFLVHYPSLTVKFGPLYHFNTLRLEAKHQFFKDLMRKNKCFKNPSLSMAKQHQLYQSYILSGSLLQIEEQGPIKKEVSSDLPFKNILPKTYMSIPIVSWIRIDGIKYIAEKCFVMIDYVNNLPCFALLFRIVYMEDIPAFVCKTVCTVEHNLHLNSYEISLEQHEFKMYQLKDLFVHSVYHAHEVLQKYYIPVKRSVSDIH